MKKHTKQIAALLAASAMILGMTACGDGVHPLHLPRAGEQFGGHGLRG